MADRETLDDTQLAHPELVVTDSSNDEFDVDLCAAPQLDLNTLTPESLKHYFDHQEKMFETKIAAAFCAVLLSIFIVCVVVNIFGSVSHQYDWRPETWIMDFIVPLIGAALSKLGIDFVTYKVKKTRDEKRIGINPRGMK